MTEFARNAQIPHLEVRRSCRENACYRLHTHDALSIGGIEGGTSVLSGGLGGVVRLKAGDVVVIPAGQVHACNPEDETWRYQMLHMDQAWADGLRQVPGSGWGSGGITVLRHPRILSLLTSVTTAVFDGDTGEKIETRLATLFAHMSDAAPAHLVASSADPELLARLRPALEILRESAANPAIDDLAPLVGMTTFQFNRAVRRATGLTPLAWRQNARILRARRMLREGEPISATAHELGFVDQSHFHRVFRAHVATSPGSYRA